MSGALLELRNVSRRFHSGQEGVVALRDIDLSIQAGEMVAIMGASGSGKSTLMNILGCLDKPSSGSYRVAGRETGGMTPDELARLRRNHFGFIFQRYHLLGDLTALGNVETPAIYAGVSAAARRERAMGILDRLGLSDRLGHRPNQLSGGQQQRVSIARALMNGGEIILADEPTGALDSKSGEVVLEILKNLNAEGRTVIIVTHDRHVAEHAERIIEIRDGIIIADRRGERSNRLARESRLACPANAGFWTGLRRRFAEALPIALRAMAARKSRSALTMLGIVMGIAAVVAVVGLGEGSQRRVLGQIQDLGVNTIAIYPGKDFGDENAANITTLTVADADALAAQPYVDSVTPEVGASGTVRFGAKSVSSSIGGVGEAYFRVNGFRITLGSGFTRESVRRGLQQALIDENARKVLFKGGENPIGQIIVAHGVPLVIIGVAVRQGSGFVSKTPTVYIPYTTVLTRMTGPSSLGGLTVRVADNVDTRVAERAVVNLLTLRHGQKDFFVFNSDQLRKTYEKASRVLSLLILSIALISLIVGGIGVMNIMLVTVTERTGEIGLRMAIGARQVDIMLQFLIEALVICLAGAIAGISLALMLAHVVTSLSTDFPMIISLNSILLATLSAMIIGVGFGFVPARNAARLDPVDALSRE